jgi:hypothetical protein
LGALNLLKIKKNGFVFTPQSSKDKKRMSLNPTHLPQHFLKKHFKKRKDLYTTPCPLPKTKTKKLKTREKISICTNLINFGWKNLFCPLLFFYLHI